jgi:hypothetical protein
MRSVVIGSVKQREKFRWRRRKLYARNENGIRRSAKEDKTPLWKPRKILWKLRG